MEGQRCKHQQFEVNHESRYFDNIREFAKDNMAGPGDEFEEEVELIPVTNYYGEKRAVLVRSLTTTFGTLPEEDVVVWWPLLCAMFDANEEVKVQALFWTSPNWDEKFYASVRLAMPSIGKAEKEILEDYVELTNKNRMAWKTFENYEEEYWDPQ